jgi:hypothetical protein
VRTEPLTITGLAGPVVLETNFLTGKHSITVRGHPAPRAGRRFTLPTAGGGTVEAVRDQFLDAYPNLEIHGVKHRTGPPTPMVLRILALVPILLHRGGRGARWHDRRAGAWS